MMRVLPIHRHSLQKENWSICTFPNPVVSEPSFSSTSLWHFIYSTSIYWPPTRCQILDTPGYSSFSTLPLLSLPWRYHSVTLLTSPPPPSLSLTPAFPRASELEPFTKAHSLDFYSSLATKSSLENFVFIELTTIVLKLYLRCTVLTLVNVLVLVPSLGYLDLVKPPQPQSKCIQNWPLLSSSKPTLFPAFLIS